MRESSQPYQADSAIDVLLSPTNRGIKLYPEDNDFIRLEHRIRHLFSMTEQIINYQYLQNIKLKQKGNCPGTMPRKYLEGWNFDDLAKDRDLFYPHVTNLEASGNIWVSLIRDINADTLFGRGFGDLIQPTHSSSCPYWAKMPTQKYYLGASVSDLKNIMDNHGGDEEVNPIQLTDNIFWHSPNGTFDPCQCTETIGGQHSDLGQVLLSKPFPEEMPENGAPPLEDCGAVIFGHNKSLVWFRCDTEDFQESVHLPSANESDSDFHDSGVGRSFGSSSAFKLHIEAPTPAQYKVGIVCALPKELLAVRALFDEEHEYVTPPAHDTNYYSFGRIGRYNVVAACLPFGEYGTNSAAAVVIHLRRSFTEVEFCLLVGIGGGVPSAKNDIRRGDVVVSLPTNTDTGVIQSDLGEVHPNSAFEPTGRLQRPPRVLLSAISHLQSDPRTCRTQLRNYINDVKNCNPGYKHPGSKFDTLFASDCQHNAAHETCEQCDGPVIPRKPRRPKGPHIHYGLIASSNQVMRDAASRDRLGAKHNILCFEMEAAGVTNAIPCLVIRGICDYADSHKNKLWQEYAAAKAAAYCAIIEVVFQNLK
ncbi:nucleoside phosphorylase domain-containing protein [Aspergillus avenaceus]|uniref:Nucleoside phosphorylase domain-containing protein n=1 Tax=Aspergillus avenaceus TaxID=36643 RepID=A0A5N6TRJ4_ASPAV|nr:nucleoside phosphorylase domain-containing protein [Aspergillus avenaceus]